MFRFKWIADKRDRAYGFVWRFLGIDISLLFLGWLNDCKLVDLRIPHNYGVFLQVACILFTIGKLHDDQIYSTEG